MNYYDIMRQRAQDERNRRLQQASIDVSMGAKPVGIMPLNKLGPKLSGLNQVLFDKTPMNPNVPGGDATIGSTGYFSPYGLERTPLGPQMTATMQSRLPAANVNAVTDPASVPFLMGGEPRQNMPQFVDPRVQAMLPPLPGPARNVGPTPGAGAARGASPARGPEQFGPPMPAAFNVRGYTKGLKDVGPEAQAYADKFAGGDLSKVKARMINIDGEMKNNYYTRGLLDAPMMPEPGSAPDASTGGYGPPQPDTMDRFRMWLGGLFGGGA